MTLLQHEDRKDLMDPSDRRPRRGRRTPATAATCRCGQQLDCCTRSHCPRCGRTLDAS